MVTDAALMLWRKCKAMLVRHQSAVVGFTKCLSRIDGVGKVRRQFLPTSMKQRRHCLLAMGFSSIFTTQCHASAVYAIV